MACKCLLLTYFAIKALDPGNPFNHLTESPFLVLNYKLY